VRANTTRHFNCYLIDALAAETGAEGQFKQAYALASFNGKKEDDRQKQVDEWEAKNITLIPFDSKLIRREPYKPLDDTLAEWGRLHRGGLESRSALVLGPTSKPYLSLPEHETRKIAWALLDPAVAKEFSEADPPSHISWLEPLSAARLHVWGGKHPFIQLFDLPAKLEENQYGNIEPLCAPLAGRDAVVSSGLTEAAYGLSEWLQEMASSVEDEKRYLAIWDATWRTVADQDRLDAEEEDEDDRVFVALNKPGGKSAEGLLALL
jgi:hypothetical protein